MKIKKFKKKEGLKTYLERRTSQYCDYLYIFALFEYLCNYTDSQLFVRFKKYILSVKKEFLSAKKYILSAKKYILSVKKIHFISEKIHFKNTVFIECGFYI